MDSPDRTRKVLPFLRKCFGTSVGFFVPTVIHPVTHSQRMTNPRRTELSKEAAVQCCVGAVSLLSDIVNTVVCVVRPPGHHQGADGVSQGFCYTNNAIHAALKHLEQNDANKVIILDLDLHWGQGTESWVRYHHKKYTGRLLMLDVHSGRAGEYPPGCSDSKTELPVINVVLPMEQEKYSVSDMVHIMENLLQPMVDKHKPTLMLLSMGFDTHQEDPFGIGLWTLRSSDYWLVAEAIQLAYSGPKVVVLEGGYHVSSLQESLMFMIRGFSQEVTHSHGLSAAKNTTVRLVESALKHVEEIDQHNKKNRPSARDKTGRFVKSNDKNSVREHFEPLNNCPAILQKSEIGINFC